jgi:hypothetical protein
MHGLHQAHGLAEPSRCLIAALSQAVEPAMPSRTHDVIRCTILSSCNTLGSHIDVIFIHAWYATCYGDVLTRRQARVQFVLRIPLPQAVLGDSRRAVGRYMLTYLDEDHLIGRAQAGGGTFVFDRAPDDEVPV